MWIRMKIVDIGVMRIRKKKMIYFIEICKHCDYANQN